MPVQTTPSAAAYGSWQSPISAELVAAGLVSLSSIQADCYDVLWIEDRAAEEGRHVVVRHRQRRGTSDVIGRGASARSFVQEYGGGAYLAVEGTVWYSESVDGRLYEITDAVAGTARPITPPGAWRYADLVLDRPRRRLICIREDHTPGTITAHGEPVNTLVTVPLDGGITRILVEGNDFYSAPRISPDGTHLAWLTWHHPNMPWDGTELWVGEFGSDGGIVAARLVAGGDAESIAQPCWSPEGVLHFVSDRSGWWNLERLTDLGPSGGREQIAPMEAAFAIPEWRPGFSKYGFTEDGSIVAIARANGHDRLLRINAV